MAGVLFCGRAAYAERLSMCYFHIIQLHIDAVIDESDHKLFQQATQPIHSEYSVHH